MKLVKNGGLFLFCLQKALSLVDVVRYLFAIEQNSLSLIRLAA
jgi:hypothetical protein